MNPVEAPTKPNPIFKWLLVGLPLGLIIMGALSFIPFLKKRADREAPHPSPFAAALRREPNDADWKRYLGIFHDLGDRSPQNRDNLESAASFIESTVGSVNMGYDVVRHEFSARDKPLSHIEVELPGRAHPRQLVLVAACYDNTETAPISALLSLAHAFTGQPRGNTLRFAALVAGPDKAGRREGLAEYAQWMDKRDFDAITLIALGSKTSADLLHANLGPNATTTEDVLLPEQASLDEVKKAEERIRRLADAPSLK